MIFVYITILKIVKKREEYEREERIMALENNRNLYGQTIILNNRRNFSIPANFNYQMIDDNNNKNKPIFVSNGYKIKNIPQRKNSNSIIEGDETTLNDRLISDDRIRNSLYNRVDYFFKYF